MLGKQSERINCKGCIRSLCGDQTTKAAPQTTGETVNDHNYLMANETRHRTTTNLVFPSNMMIYKLFLPNCF